MPFLFRTLTAIVLLVFAIQSLAVVVLLAIVAGLFFRTKQTLGLLFLLGILTAVTANPVIGLAVVGIAAIFAGQRKRTQLNAVSATFPNRMEIASPRTKGGIP